jgi:hypothetical protein
MKWVLWIVGGLVVLVGLMAAIGAMLPVRHQASRRAKYRATPDALYRVMTGPPDWRPGVKASGSVSDKSWWEQDSRGQKITYEVVEDQGPSRRVVRIADRGLPFGGTWTYEIAPEEGGSELRITEDGEIYNVIFRFLAKTVFGYTSTMDAYLSDLKRKFGE